MGLFSKFKKDKSNKENPFQDYLENFLQNHGIRNESELYHQPKELQMRANPDNILTLGMLLNKTFDVRKEELSDLYVVTDYQKGVGEMIKNEDDIWNYDLCSHLIEYTNEGYSYKDGRVVLIIAYRDVLRDKDIDRSISRRYGTITIHLGKQQSGSMNNTEEDLSFYICATICMSPMALEKPKYSVQDYEKLQPKSLSVTFAFDTTPSEQKKAEYEYLHEQVLEKINNKQLDKLTSKENYLIDTIRTDIGKDFYWGGKVLEGKRFWDAIIYFTQVFDALQEKWIEADLTDEEKNVFFESCFRLGFCFCELKLYEKAYYYLDIVFGIDNIEYKMEYINCLVNKKDFRAFNVVSNEIDRISKIENPESLDWFGHYYHFLWRRIAYIYVDMGKLDKAEDLLKDMLKENPDYDWVLNELAYIQGLKKQRE